VLINLWERPQRSLCAAKAAPWQLNFTDYPSP
jgi:hypothetical protein